MKPLSQRVAPPRSLGLRNYPGRPGSLPISLNTAMLKRLAFEARERRIKSTTLAKRILEAVVGDDLITAVLDDQEACQ